MNQFDRIRDLYTSSHHRHGDSSAAMLTPKGRHSLRYRPVTEYLLMYPNKSILDYGCGLGFLKSHLDAHGVSADYTGMDITHSFIESCRRRHSSAARFGLVDPLQPIQEKFDAVFCSGVFNIVTSSDPTESMSYVRLRLEQLLVSTKEVLFCDFLSPLVDFKQEEAQHIDFRTVLDWLKDWDLRRFVIRHDLLPYEFMIAIYKNDQIKKPENIYESQM